jgi:hypothetical protein
MIEADYQRLAKLAAASDRTPSTFALELVKAAFDGLDKPFKRPLAALNPVQAKNGSAVAKERPKAPEPGLNREQKRMRAKLEAEQAKKKGK